MRILDIGCGWGGFAKFAVQNSGASVFGITVSKEQSQFAREKCRGMPVEIRLQDYRELKGGKFDAIVSIGMMEHVGAKNYRTYMEVARRNLKPGGLFLLQTIGGNTPVAGIDGWKAKYTFPNAVLPSVNQISKACKGLFVIEDWHNFGPDYDKTLMAWFDNFNRHWDSLKKQYSERFYRMWKFYLLTCAGAFRAGRNQLWQVVFSDSGVKGGYVPVR